MPTLPTELLLLEDSPTVRSAVGEMLARRGVNVHYASTPEAALALLGVLPRLVSVARVGPGFWAGSYAPQPAADLTVWRCLNEVYEPRTQNQDRLHQS